MIRHLTIREAANLFGGVRVRALWNPRAGIWYVFGFDDDKKPLFSTFALELHTVGVYGELRPKWAPDGTPSFVGTVCAHEVVDVEKAEEVKAHPYAPAVLYFVRPGDEEVETFDHCRRLYVNRQRMYADRRPITTKETQK